MGWTYRVVRRQASGMESGSLVGIHEAFDDGGEPTDITTKPVAVFAETPEELAQVLERMRAALAKPELRFEDF